jgi:uncharacterized protein (DUF1697 family)
LADEKRQIALLRGINLASRRRLSMAELRELLTGLGYKDVRTFLQSGNVVLTSSASPTGLQRKLEKEIAANLGVETQVIVRTRDELADVIECDPLGNVANNPSRYLVSFLSARPNPKVVRDLAGLDVEPEQFVISGRELYAWHPNGVQRSKLNKLVTERRLGVIATARNWNTVTRLLALADE